MTDDNDLGALVDRPRQHIDDVSFEDYDPPEYDTPDDLLTIDKIGERHKWLAETMPNWSKTMAQIKNRGGPWHCESCDDPSYLCFRCSICGSDLTGDS